MIGMGEFVRRFLRRPTAIFGLPLFLLLALFAFLGGSLWKHSYKTREFPRLAAPSRDHPFGTEPARCRHACPGYPRHPDVDDRRRLGTRRGHSWRRGTSLPWQREHSSVASRRERSIRSSWTLPWQRDLWSCAWDGGRSSGLACGHRTRRSVCKCWYTGPGPDCAIIRGCRWGRTRHLRWSSWRFSTVADRPTDDLRTREPSAT